ncbi:MAG: hypothetical protein AB8G96_09545 [Phycisphaerales bacterium]
MREFDSDTLSWAALLAQCSDFAKASAAWGESGDEGRWRTSTAPIIALQSTTFALHQLSRVEEAERPLARDKAEMTIRREVGAIDAAWRGIPMPAELLALQDEARTALERSNYVDAVELVWTGEEPFEVPAGLARIVDAIECGREPRAGTLLVAQPGTLIMPGSPVAWWNERPWPDVNGAFDALEPIETDRPRQIYRQLNAVGRIFGDSVRPIWSEPDAGMPLLVPLLDRGRTVGRFTVDPEHWAEQQRAAMDAGPNGCIPVVEWDGMTGMTGMGDHASPMVETEIPPNAGPGAPADRAMDVAAGTNPGIAGLRADEGFRR